MRNDIQYTKMDGRDEDVGFHNRLRNTVLGLDEHEGLLLIKEFEPTPLYPFMENLGFDHHCIEISADEFHTWFYRPAESRSMDSHLELDMDRIETIMNIKRQFVSGYISMESARDELHREFTEISVDEFAYAEQKLKSEGVDDDVITEKMDDIIRLFKPFLRHHEERLPDWHPIKAYLDECQEFESLLESMEALRSGKFIINPWLIVYEKLETINTHFARKQNQLFPLLEQKGFDRPSRIMWTFDNGVRDSIKKGRILLDSEKQAEFLEHQDQVIELVRDIIDKEREVLYPTSLKLISEKEFLMMRSSDEEIGYALISTPPPGPQITAQSESLPYSSVSTSAESMSLAADLAAILQRHGVGIADDKRGELDVSRGKLTLEQINLMYRHMPVDFSFVDENDIVRFYSDTTERVFPRSPGVIGRAVQNCHPRESVDTVERILKAFKAGTHSTAEFWLELGGKFLYILYTAVRDENGAYRGTLEMMQDVTRIRSLSGTQRLLNWDNESAGAGTIADTVDEPAGARTAGNPGELSADTRLSELLAAHPLVKDYLISLTPKFKKLKNPILFKTMSSMATLGMIAERGGLNLEDFINGIQREIRNSEDAAPDIDNE
ncbi:PAS domain-containing protein [Salinispira pacifica]|uniref:DUF1858 domain-containing protein n=1 Tax=Salinispira pacifica TaxID=1307761 RepID=V5WE15_9SPIO|nr:PAS domain-containing protein [Salinispira pacifica]AHC14033.1 hypothetical protein L21SP2_0604 [Salinispira pacifica]